MRFFRKAKGAISIFLVIILVPMMTMSAMFVDASKVKLAKAMAESAGDLTLNTALTNYDTKLKELYGLLATTQNTDDLFAKLEDYYRTCITSAGVPEEDAATYTERIMAQLGVISNSDDTADLMNLELVDFSVEKYADGDLANAAVLKKQIVDFMKYRAPINTGLRFVEALQSFSTLSKQSELVEKKQEYYEEQQSVMEDLKTAWSYIASYNKSAIVTNSSYLTNIKPTMDGFKASYEDYGARTIMSLYQKYNTIVADRYSVGSESEELYTYDIATGEKGERQEYKTYSYQGTKYYPYLSEKYNNPYNYENKKLPTKSDVESAIKGFYTANNREPVAPSFASGTDYQLQFMAQKRGDINAYTSGELNFYLAYHKLKNVILWLDGYDTIEIKDEDGKVITKDSILAEKLTLGKETKTLEEWLKTLKYDSLYGTRMYDFDINIGIYNQCAWKAHEQYYEAYNITESLTIDQAIQNVHDKANGYVSTLDTAIKNLEDAIKYLESAKTKLTGSLATAKTNWNTVANDSSIKDTSLAKQNQAEINQVEKYLNETNITKMVTRLTNIKTDLTSVRDQVKAYTFAGKFLGDIDGYDGEKGLETLVGTKWTDLKQLSIVKTEVTNTAKSRSAGAWSAGSIKTDWIKQSQHQPSLLEDKLSLYTYMSSHFGGTEIETSSNSTSVKTEDTTNGKTLYNDIKSTSESQANGKSGSADDGQAASETSKGNNITTEKFSNLPSSGKTGSDTPSSSVNTKIDGSTDKNGKEQKGAAGKSASALGKLFSADFLSAVADLAEDFRDKLYVSDYIMSMFSYDTIENEYNVKNDKAKGTEIPAGTILTLTKNDISETNNYAYGAEIEYIIYGGTNSSNLTKAYGTIYAIRFGFNLVYAFATSEIRDSALALATPISAATLGVIPVPLIQAVIIIGIACCESAIDLVDLRDGKQVPLYKSSETWHCSISGLTNLAKNKVGQVFKEVANTAVSEGVNKLNEILDMTDEELTKAIEGGTNKVEEAVLNAYDQLITENANMAIQQLTTLVNTAVQNVYCLDYTETLDGKKTEMKQWVKDQMVAWAGNITGDDIASTIKREAVNVIVQNSDTCIDQLFDTVLTTVQNSTAGTTIDGILADAQSVTNGVDQLGGQVMEYVTLIRTKIKDTINAGSSEVIAYKEKLKTSIQSSISQGAESLKETLNTQIDGIFGGAGGGDDSSNTVASLCSFSYSDYLRLFLMIGLYTNEEKILLRTADVVQANMVHMGDKGFKMSSAATYVKISATIQVKPTLLALPLFADVEKNPADNSNWYTITYSGIAGY